MVSTGENIIRPPKLDQPLAMKLNKLRKKIRQLEGVVVAFSGGLDSAVLARICQQELGEKAVAITVNSANYQQSDLILAKRLAKIIGIRHKCIESDADCTGKVFLQVKSAATALETDHVVSGSHLDDKADGSFSFWASKEHGIKTPLYDSKINKSDIIKLSRHVGIDISKNHAKKVADSFIRSLGLISTKFVTTKKKSSLLVHSKSDLLNISNHLDIIEQRLCDLGFKHLSIVYNQK
jgi:PP-loop superfamily ATP-utilizing enzyme